MHEISQLLCQLVRIPSISGQEQPIATFIKEYLEPFCDRVCMDSMYNVVAEIKGNRPGQTVLFNAHIDHAPVGDMENPYEGIIMGAAAFGEEGTAVYGRGACDNKGAVACMMMAGKRLAEDRNFPGTLILMFVAQEENGQAPGTSFALKNLDRKVDVAVLGEATNLDIYLGHRGKVEFFLDTIGKSSHASNPGNGINAVELMSDFIQEMNRLPLPEHEILGKCTWALTYISCPDPGKAAIVPANCSIRFDCRYLPDETSDSVFGKVEDILKRLSQENLSFRYDLRQNYVMPPFYTDKAHPYVKTMQEAITKVRGQQPQFGAWLFGGDGTFMVNDFDIPTIGFGPAEEQYAHSARDHVLERDLDQAVQVYEAIMRTNL